MPRSAGQAASMMRIIGLAGWSGSGKKTLVPNGIPVLVKRGRADLIRCEGLKRHSHPKLEVSRAVVGKPLLHPDDDCIVAIATDAPLPQAEVPVLMLDDIESIADMLQAEALPRDQIGSSDGAKSRGEA